jgi:rare lipoprotein A
VHLRALLLLLACCVAACTTTAPPPPPPAPVAPPERPSFTQTGNASWYGSGHQGHATASGEPFDKNQLTAAHRTLPLNTIVRVTNVATHKTVKLKINDRGPFTGKRIIDLSERAARELGIVDDGVVKVKLEVYNSDQPPAGQDASAPSS